MTAPILHPDIAAGIYEWLATMVTQPSGWRWLGLLDTAGSEVAGGAYVRVELDDATNMNGLGGLVFNSIDLDFPGMPAVTVRYFALFDEPSGGNLMVQQQFDVDTVVPGGATFTIGSGDLELSAVYNADSSTDTDTVTRIAWYLAGVRDLPNPPVGSYPYGIEPDPLTAPMAMDLADVPAFEAFGATVAGQGSSTERWFNVYTAPEAAGTDRIDLVQRTDFVGVTPPWQIGGAAFTALAPPDTDDQLRLEAGDLTIAVAEYDTGAQQVYVELTFTAAPTLVTTPDVISSGSHDATLTVDGTAEWSRHDVPLIDALDAPSTIGLNIATNEADLEVLERAGWSLGFLPQ